MQYTVQMWLSYTPTDPGAESEFRKRFPASLEEAWEALSITATNQSQLASNLNGQILSYCKGDITADTGIDATALEAFTEGVWKGSGTHQTETPVHIDVTEPSSAPWTFTYNSTTYQMTAACEF